MKHVTVVVSGLEAVAVFEHKSDADAYADKYQPGGFSTAFVVKEFPVFRTLAEAPVPDGF